MYCEGIWATTTYRYTGRMNQRNRTAVQHAEIGLRAKKKCCATVTSSMRLVTCGYASGQNVFRGQWHSSMQLLRVRIRKPLPRSIVPAVTAVYHASGRIARDIWRKSMGPFSAVGQRQCSFETRISVNI
jgi:hypothetical protein